MTLRALKNVVLAMKIGKQCGFGDSKVIPIVLNSTVLYCIRAFQKCGRLRRVFTMIGALRHAQACVRRRDPDGRVNQIQICVELSHTRWKTLGNYKMLNVRGYFEEI